MKTRILRAIVRISVLLGLAGVLAVNAVAGGGPFPTPPDSGNPNFQQGW